MTFFFQQCQIDIAPGVTSLHLNRYAHHFPITYNLSLAKITPLVIEQITDDESEASLFGIGFYGLTSS